MRNSGLAPPGSQTNAHAITAKTINLRAHVIADEKNAISGPDDS